MARQLDPGEVRCREHDQLARAFLRNRFADRWEPACSHCLDEFANDDRSVYVRFGDDRDRSDTPAPLKHDPPGADN